MTDEYIHSKFAETGYPGISQADIMRSFGAIAPGSIIEHEPGPWPIGQLRIKCWIDEGLYTLEINNPPSEQSERILLRVLPKVLELFLNKNKDYADWPDLGLKGEFVEIWRKVHKLKSAIWDGKELVGEQDDEVLMDLFGHVLLALLARLPD